MSFLFKKAPKKVTRLFYSTDLHGSERTYRKFINAGKFYQADVLIMGGDITGKLLIPIIKDKNGRIPDYCPGEANSLLFSTRKSDAPFAHHAVVSLIER